MDQHGSVSTQRVVVARRFPIRRPRRGWTLAVPRRAHRHVSVRLHAPPRNERHVDRHTVTFEGDRRPMKSKILIVVSAFACAAAGAAAVAAAEGPTDAQIAAIVVTANQVDIDAGKLAESKGSNAEVKAFGKQMVTDHTGVNKQASDLVTKLGVKPEDNPTAQSLKSGGADNVKTLSGLSGAA